MTDWLWRIVQRFLVFAGLWLVLTGADVEAVPYGIVPVALVTWMSMWLLPVGWRWRMGFGALRILPTFVWRAVAGGVDVAKRALSPGQNYNPAILRFPLRHGDGGVPVLMAYILTGLPGSLTVNVEDGHMILHVLDPAMASPEMVAALEDRVAAMLR